MTSSEVSVALFHALRNSTIPAAHAVVRDEPEIADRHVQRAVTIDQVERVIEPSVAVRLP